MTFSALFGIFTLNLYLSANFISRYLGQGATQLLFRAICNSRYECSCIRRSQRKGRNHLYFYLPMFYLANSLSPPWLIPRLPTFRTTPAMFREYHRCKWRIQGQVPANTDAAPPCHIAERCHKRLCIGGFRLFQVRLQCPLSDLLTVF